ncbi:mechanosensitive ion channel family protein [Erythrobacter aurantius]|uniref:mechanosensitive ion channel family protein n=1 Tax=Erythrobacter aurantius TaxID=2909249 RepID=UPI00207A0D83|nr:mechanosensitive ion channel domain-containing protein [Erythrobacter aurantius]
MTAPTPPAAEATPATEAAPAIVPPGQVWSLAEEAPAPEAVVSIGEGSKQAIASQSETLAEVVDALDKWALTFGDIRVSLFDVLLVVATIALVITVAWTLTRVARKLLRNVSHFDEAQKVLAEKLVTVLIWTLAFFIAVDMVGIDLTALAFFGGAFGLAIGFGLQKTFGNLISGILLLLDKSIKPGDVISVTDAAGNEAVGQIRKIGIRAISVITRDQTEHLIPNENLMVNQVVNWSYSSKDVRVKAPVGVSYDSDLDLVTELLYKAVEDTPRVLPFPKPRVNLMGFGDNSVDFEIRFWIQDPEEGLANIRSDVYMRMWQLFKENGIEIPYPQRDLHLRSSKQLDQIVEMMGGKKA